MKRFNIFFICLLVCGIFFAQGVYAWSFGFNKKAKPLKEETPKATEEYVFPLDKQDNKYNLLDNTVDVNAPAEHVEEMSVEKTDMLDSDATFGKDMDLKSDTVDVYTDTSQYVAKGHAALIIPSEDFQMTANEIIVDHRNYEITGIGNVKIIKDGDEHYGDYIRFDTKREASFFKNPILYYDNLTITSNSAVMHSDKNIAKDGVAIAKSTKTSVITSSEMAGIEPHRLFDPDKVFDAESDDNKIVAKKVHVVRKGDVNDILMERVTFYSGTHKIAYAPIFKFTSNRDVNYVETIFPEIGNERRIGTYIAPGWVFPMPKGSTLKLGPLFSLATGSNSSSNTNNAFGVGAFARLSTPKSTSVAMYSSATNKLFADARYRFNKEFSLRFNMNDYIDNGWMGGQLANYGLEFVYDKGGSIPQANITYTNRFGAGFFRDNGVDYETPDGPLGTMRYTWQMTMMNGSPLLAWKKYLMFGYSYQHYFALYQTGDTLGVVRVGPRVYSDLGRLYWELTYYVAAQAGDTPFIFDRYHYGHSNVTLRAQYYINKYLSVGYYGSYNMDRPDWEGNRLTENQLVISAGTEDVKVKFGWDTIRRSAVVGLDMLIGKNKTYMEFDEMDVKNMEPKEKESDTKLRQKAHKQKV